MRSVPSAPLVGPFAERLLALDLPELAAERRAEVVRFTSRRVDGLPSVVHVGVLLIAAVVRVLLLLPGSDGLVRVLARTSLPVVGEYVRLVRSLAYAFVWETWPETRPLGSAA